MSAVCGFDPRNGSGRGKYMTNNRAIFALLFVVVTLATFTAALTVSSANTVLNVGSAVTAPVQSGGPYVIKPSVIAGGGGTSSNGTTRIDGTVGQSVLGTSSGGNFSLNSGFWQATPASSIDISGLITYCTAAGSPGVPHTMVHMTQRPTRTR